MGKQESHPNDDTTNTSATDAELPAHKRRWNKTWNDFNRALQSPEPFNPFPWIFRIVLAGLDYGYCQIGLEKYQLHRRWNSAIPLFVIGLVLFLLLLYVISFRSMIRERWCPGGTAVCHALPCHDAMIVYLSGMVLYNYLKTNLTSPGVTLSTRTKHKVWSCMNNQGGFYGSFGYPKLDVAAEDHRVSLYGKLDQVREQEIDTVKAPSEKIKTAKAQPKSPSNHNTPATTVFPSNNPSHCAKCNVTRPPRCHHCRVCNRCVLQFDHHCIWVNNCIGYNNYRSFLALLLSLVVACWYSLCVMMVPFYELIQVEEARQLSEYESTDEPSALMKWILAYQRSQFFEDVPTNPWDFFQACQSDRGLPWTVAIKIAYPLLLGIGTIMAVFLGFHLQYVAKARTTLEHKIVLETLCTSLWQESFAGTSLPSKEGSVMNPFDDGWRNNIRRMVGPTPWFLLFPFHMEVPAPFIPDRFYECKKTT